jgi:hypothetical protein
VHSVADQCRPSTTVSGARDISTFSVRLQTAPPTTLEAARNDWKGPGENPARAYVSRTINPTKSARFWADPPTFFDVGSKINIQDYDNLGIESMFPTPKIAECQEQRIVEQTCDCL